MKRKSAKEIRRAAWTALGEDGQYLRYVAAYMLLALVAAVVSTLVACMLHAGIVISGIGPYFAPGGCPDIGLLTDCSVMFPFVSFVLGAIALSFYPIGFYSWGQAAMAIAAARHGITVGHSFSGWGHGWRMGCVKFVKWLYLLPWLLLYLAPLLAFEWQALTSPEHDWLGFVHRPDILFGMLLLGVPLYLKYLSYVMTEFVAVDNPDWAANRCIAESRRMMHGCRWRYVCLLMSFFGWLLLVSIASRYQMLKQLAQLFFMPYFDTSRAMFYEDLLDCAEGAASCVTDGGASGGAERIEPDRVETIA